MTAQSLPRPLFDRRLPLANRAHVRLLAVLAIGALLVTALISPTAARGTAGTTLQRLGAQSLSLQVLPPIRQPGATPASSRAASTVVTATLNPPQSGRAMTLQRRNQQGWKTKATLLTDAAGRAEFFVPSSGAAAASYRVIAQSFRGLARRKSEVVATNAWGAPDFTDEFSGETIGSAWENRIQFHNPWGGRACSKGSPDAVRMADGALRLSSRPDPAATTACTALDGAGNVLGDFPYRLNGHVSTQSSFDFLYGVAAARMKFQRNPGAHPSFWLQPKGLLETGPTSWGAEIDVIEWYGRSGKRDRLASTVHAPLPSGAKVQFGGSVARPSRFLASRTDTWWRNYHVFSVEWTPTEYIFRIGAHEVWRTDQGVSHDPEFLILSMLSSDFELPSLGDRQGVTQTASVDWVKVWEADSTSVS